ncbi:MAG TPA: FecR domain-containing protein [Desulfopila sp.]|nr:FecR domain-containing protein [Desulfopila sp.]
MLFAVPGMAEQGDVAQVSQLSGDVVIERQGEDITVVEGTRLQVGDLLKTGIDGAIGIVFNDETTLSIGPKTKISIQDYLFETDTSSFSFIIKIFKGTASYVSGLIAKLSPESARFITPSATIGIRGTKFVIEVDGL